MANAAYNLELKGKQVVFGIVTGKGRKGKKPENEYTMAVEVTATEKKKIIAEMETFFKDQAGKNDKMAHSPEDFFSESEDTKGSFIFWASEVVSQQIEYLVEDGSDYTMQNFADLGAGSIVDVEYRIFFFNNSFGVGVGMRLKAVKLIEFTKFTGGSSNLKGKKLQSDGVAATASASEESDSDEYEDVIAEFNDALDDGDWAEAKELLEELEDHDDYKKFKKKLRKAKG